MNLELASVMVMTAIVVNVSGILFILETLQRRDEGAGRIWALAFLAGMLTTIAYLVWVQSPGAWWAVAVGNASFVASTGCMWLGCRRYNERRTAWAPALVAVAAAAAAAAVVAAGPDGGDWAGALWMFIPLLAFGGLAAVECLRGSLGESRTAWVLSGVLGFQALYYISRTTAFVTSGPESALFQTAFGTITTSIITVTLTIVAVVVTSVLRAGRAPMRGYLLPTAPGSAQDDILSEDAFATAVGHLCRRASRRAETVGVISVQVDDLEQISTAFGSEVARAVFEAWRTGVRVHAPTDALVADDGATGVLVGLLAGTPLDARRIAGAIYRGLFEDLGRVGGGIIPVVGVGVGLSDSAGYDAAELTRVAREAAGRAAATIDTSVLVGDAE